MDTKQIDVKRRDAHAMEDPDTDYNRRGGRDEDVPLVEREGEQDGD